MIALKKVSKSTTLIAIGLVAGVVTAGGVAQAATAAPNAKGSGSAQEGHGRGGHGGPDGQGFDDQGGARDGGPGRALHGEFVTVDPAKAGSYVTRDTQVGLITAVTSTALTVKSVDGFAQTWVVTAATKVRAAGKKASSTAALVTDLAVGSTVDVSGVKNPDGSFTASHVSAPRPRGVSPTPSASASASPSA